MHDYSLFFHRPQELSTLSECLRSHLPTAKSQFTWESAILSTISRMSIQSVRKSSPATAGRVENSVSEIPQIAFHGSYKECSSNLAPIREEFDKNFGSPFSSRRRSRAYRPGLCQRPKGLWARSRRFPVWPRRFGRIRFNIPQRFVLGIRTGELTQRQGCCFNGGADKNISATKKLPPKFQLH